MNNLSFLRDELYSLKMSYGGLGAVYRSVPGVTDLTTGKTSLVRTKITIDRLIVMPVKFETTQFFSPALLKAGRQFSYGGDQNKETKRVIIDGTDLPSGFQLAPDDYLVIQHKRYEIVYFEQLEEFAGYQLIVQRITGVPVNEIHEITVRQSLRILQRGKVVP